MDFHVVECGGLPIGANISRYRGEKGVDEYHLVVTPMEYEDIETQLESVEQAYLYTLDSLGLDIETSRLRRFFCSDPVNQVPSLGKKTFSSPGSPGASCAVSWAGQAPAPPAKIALWAYHVTLPGKTEKGQEGDSFTFRRGRLSHYWTTGMTCAEAGTTSCEQTRGILEKYAAFLEGHGLTLADHVMRTWFFVQNIDANYQGLVTARREFFKEHGLTPDTHFIASTGIEGAPADIAAKVTMDAYAISGIERGQIEYLSALDHLSPTYIYGLTFERGTSITYQDRRHVIISGTASIDREGKIVHEGNVTRQLDRTLENVAALLQTAGATLKNMAVFVAYVRDPSDIEIVRQRMRDRIGDAPLVIAVAPVCRPGWLVEVEGLAIVPSSNPSLPEF